MGAFVITLREGFEAALVIGLILAFLHKTGYGDRARAVWAGVIAAVSLSIIGGAVLFLSGATLEGNSKYLFEGLAMLLAASVVTWMVFWMRRQAATIGSDLRQHVSLSIEKGSDYALGAIAFVGVGREGLETALFLFASVESSGAMLAVVSGLVGLAVAMLLGVLFYRGALKMDLRKFFTYTSVLVIGFAAYLIYGAVHEFGELLGSELIEFLAPIAAAVYGISFAALYLRDYLQLRRRRAVKRASAAQG